MAKYEEKASEKVVLEDGWSLVFCQTFIEIEIERKRLPTKKKKSDLETERDGLAAIRKVAVLGDWKDGIRQKV